MTNILNINKIDTKAYWDDAVMEAFNLDSNLVSLEKLTTKLKKDNILIKGNYIRINDDIKKLLLKSPSWKNRSKVRVNIFISYLLSHFSVSNNVPSCYYCSYKKDFNEIPVNDFNKILNKFEV